MLTNTAIDVLKNKSGEYEVYSHCGTRATALHPKEWAHRVCELGAGEILLTSIERDGTMKGYDIELTKMVTSTVSIPVIASGGAGSYEDMYEVLKEGKANAVAAASIFHFTLQTPREAKLYLAERGIPVRL